MVWNWSERLGWGMALVRACGDLVLGPVARVNPRPVLGPSACNGGGSSAPHRRGWAPTTLPPTLPPAHAAPYTLC